MKTKNTTPVYDSLCAIHRGFEQVIEELNRVTQLDGFRGRPPIKSVELAVRETHAWLMFEILEVLSERAEREWTRLGQFRSAHEKSLEEGRKRTSRKRRPAPES